MIASTQTNAPLSGVEQRDGGAESSLELATARLKAAGLRVTQPRVAILTALSALERPATIEQIHSAIGLEACDLVTVYRCVAAFQKIGLVTRAFLRNGTALYRLSLGRPERCHVVCNATNQIEEIRGESAAELRRAIAAVEDQLRARGYRDVGHLVEFFGTRPGYSLDSEPAPPTRL